MITSFEIGNFKAFAETQTIPLKPITLIFGPNSSGKSSIIQGLLWLHHAVKTGQIDVTCPVLGAGTVDLGGFGQFIHGPRGRKDPHLHVSVMVSAQAVARRLDDKLRQDARRLGTEAKPTWEPLFAGLREIGWELLFSAPESTGGVFGEPLLSTASLVIDGHPVFGASGRDGDALSVDSADFTHPLVRKTVASIVDQETWLSVPSEALMERTLVAADKYVSEWRFKVEGILPVHLFEEGRSSWSSDLMGEIGDLPSNADALARNHLPEWISSVARVVSSMIREACESFAYLGPLRCMPPRHMAFTDGDTVTTGAAGESAWYTLRRDANVRKMVNAWLGSKERLQTPYELVPRSYHSDSALEHALRVYGQHIADDAAIGTLVAQIMDDPGFKDALGNADAMVHGDPGRDSEAVREATRQSVRAMLQQFFELEGSMRSAEAQTEMAQAPLGQTDLVLIDRRTQSEVSHRDVGVGISQVLPVLVAAFGETGKTIAMEQPEIHLHPALQAELCDVFIESALGDSRNRFILETHSEHLILRLLRRIREASKQPSPRIRPEDVSVVYVLPTAEGSIVRELAITDSGQFLDGWPGGFFPERLKELF